MAEIEWRWKPEEIAAVRAIAEEQAGSNYVAWRRRQTLDNPPPLNGRAQFWYALVMCLLTSQQKSGPRSAVTRFLSLKPFPLSLEWCEAGMTETAAADIVKGSGGLRFHARIARFLTTNLRALSGPGWASNRTVDLAAE